MPVTPSALRAASSRRGLSSLLQPDRHAMPSTLRAPAAAAADSSSTPPVGSALHTVADVGVVDPSVPGSVNLVIADVDRIVGHTVPVRDPAGDHPGATDDHEVRMVSLPVCVRDSIGNRLIARRVPCRARDSGAVGTLRGNADTFENRSGRFGVRDLPQYRRYFRKVYRPVHGSTPRRMYPSLPLAQSPRRLHPAALAGEDFPFGSTPGFPSLTAPRRFLSHTRRTWGALNCKCANTGYTSACIRHGASG